MFNLFKADPNTVVQSFYTDRNELQALELQSQNLQEQLSTIISRFKVIGTENLTKSETGKLHRKLTDISSEVVLERDDLSKRISHLRKSIDKQLSKHSYLERLPIHVNEIMTEAHFIESIKKAKTPAELRDLRSMKLLDLGKVAIMVKESLAKATYSDAIVKNDKGEILLIQRNIDDDIYPGLYGLPGGHVEEGEDVVDGAVRELKEETNIDAVDPMLIGSVRNGDANLNYVLVQTESEGFHTSGQFKNPMILDADETVNYIWVDLEDISKIDAIPGLADNLNKFLGGPQPIRKGLDTSKLVRKQITVNRDGKSFTTYRWVNPESGLPVKQVDTKLPTPVVGDASQNVNTILNSNSNGAEKIRHLINLGITDKKSLTALGFSYQSVRGVLKAANLFETGGTPSEQIIVDKGDYYKQEGDEFVEQPVEQLENTSIDALVEAEIQALIDGGDIDFSVEDKPNEFTGKDKVDSAMDTFTDMVASGKRKLAMFYGLGGVGKTYGVKQVLTNPETLAANGNSMGHDMIEYDPELNPTDDEYDYVKITGKITGKKMYETLYEHKTKLIMLDDADSLFDDPTAINLLKGALDTSSEVVSYKGQQPKIDGEPIPTSMRFKGGVIIISNLTETQIRKKGASALLDSRALALDTSRSMEETIEKLDFIKDKMPFEDSKGEAMEVSADARDSAVSMMKTYSKYLPLERVNARTLGALALIYQNHDFRNEKQLINSFDARSILGVTREKIAGSIRNKLLEQAEIEKSNAKTNALLGRHLTMKQ